MLKSVRPSIERAERQRAEKPVTYVLDGFAVVAANVVVTPHRSELGTEPAEFIDERLDLCGGSCARGIHPEPTQHDPRHTFPIVLRSAGARVEEDEAQDVALLRRQRVHQHRGPRPVPGDDIRYRGSDHGGARLHPAYACVCYWRYRFVGSAAVKDLVVAGHEGARPLPFGRQSVSPGCWRRGSIVGRSRIRRASRRAPPDRMGVIHLAFNHYFSRSVQNCQDHRRVINAVGWFLPASTGR